MVPCLATAQRHTSAGGPQPVILQMYIRAGICCGQTTWSDHSISRSARMAAPENRAWKIVLEHVEGRLLSGELTPGDHLSPERALAADRNGGRSSVREALRVLEVFGLIRTQTGSGQQSGAIIIASPSSAIGALMRMQVAARGFQVHEIVRTRLLLETAVVADLAERSGSVDLTTASTLLDAMEASQLTQAEFLALDAQF